MGIKHTRRAARMGNRLPRTGLIFYAKAPGVVDNIGVYSASEFWAACPVAHRSIYSADGSAFYSAATIITNIEASAELNDGGELVGSATKGYAQYADNTAESVLRRAYEYFGQAFHTSTLWNDSQNWNDLSIWSD